MEADLIDILIRSNIAISIAIILALVLRRPFRNWVGARNTYTLWVLPLFCVAASFLPARRINVPAEIPGVSLRNGGTDALEKPDIAPTIPVTPAAESLPILSTVPWDMILLGVWLVGVVATLCMLCWQQYRFLKSLGQLEPARFDGVEVFRTRLNSVGPALVGALSPRVVVPADFDDLFTPEERALVLAHEQMHLSRGDAQSNAVAALIRCFFWYNPLVHIGITAMREDQEMACDEAVLATRQRALVNYAQALLKTQIAPTPLPIGCTWPATGRHPLKERMTALAKESPTPMSSRAGALAIASIALTAGASAWSAQPPVMVMAQGAGIEAAIQPAPLPSVQPRNTGTALTSFIDQLAAAGLTDLTVDQLIALKIHGVDPEMIRAVREMGFDPDPDDLVALAVAEVTPAFVAQVRQQGWPDVEIDDLVAMRHMDVDLKDAERFSKLGLKKISISHLIQFSALGVTVDYVRSLQAEGITEIDPDAYAHAKAMDVTAQFIADVRDRGFDNLTLRKLGRLKAENIF